jgi:hypothetical protein
MKKIENRIRDSFSIDDREDLVRYLGWARSTISEYTQNIRRSSTVLVLLIAVFELVVNSRNGLVSIGSFQITRNSLALVFLPMIVAFLLLQVVTDTEKAGRVGTAFCEAFRLWSKKASENGLDVLLASPTPLYWNTKDILFRDVTFDPIDTVETIGGLSLLVITLIGVLAFEAQAYYVLYPIRGSGLFPWLISLLVTVFCLISVAFTLILPSAGQ